MKGTRDKGQGTRVGARSAASSFIHFSFLALGFAMLAPGPVLAQSGNDPTRPPVGFDTGVAEGDAADGGGGITLQSVMISPTGRAAIINGVMVRQGEKYGDAVLVRVTESEVVLKSGSESQVLKLYPGVEKRAAAQSPAKGAPRKRKAPQ
jgi:MSHA biogenesis protein MshK